MECSESMIEICELTRSDRDADNSPEAASQTLWLLKFFR
jgi:hypothetical protein